MPLDDREQKILEEIERQFYEEDPRLAETVRRTTLASMTARNLKWALLGLVGGLALMLGFFTRQTFVALAGFAIMVLSVAWVVAIVKRRVGVGVKSPGAWVGRFRGRWSRRR
jgi:uncharacterized membrane protein YphA (DoxX/SURF4 family)